MKKLFFTTIGLLITSLLMIDASYKKSGDELNISWEKKASGVWISEIGKVEEFNLLKAAGIKPDLDAINKKSDIKFPLEKNLIKAVNLNGKLYLRFPLEDDEQIYGLGLEFKSINRRGNVYRLHVDHYGGVDNGRTHAPVPFYVSSNGYGVLINSARYITIYVGTTVRRDSPEQPKIYDRNLDKDWTSQPKSDAIEMLIPAQGTEIIVFAGDSPLDVVSRYNLFCGGGVLPPKWGLGFTYRTPTLFSDKDVINEVKDFEKHKFPLDFIGLEPGWQSASYPCTYVWDKNRFPNPKEFVQKLLSMNVKTNLWMNPYVSPKSPIYNNILPYCGSHTVWTGVVPDYSLKEAQNIFLNLFKKKI